MKYVPVIGLEVHIEQSTKSKMFCGDSAEYFGAKPNTHVCPVCLGLPGALPFANGEAVINTIKFGLALNCEIASLSKFDRKHYFYPDLPKGYQISQYDLPLCTEGNYETITGKKVNITRIHLEEDTGKLVHRTINEENVSLIDFNRSGVPLMEMVTEPDFDDPDDVIEFLQEVQQIVRYLGISDADMEKGSMRLEANISLKNKDQKDLPDYKIELKNINSFKFLKKALKAEIVRQEKLLIKGDKIPQETRGYDEQNDRTFSQRIKEEAQDYRYFPEPDLPPLTFAPKDIDKLRDDLPQLPMEKRERYKNEMGIPDNYIHIIVEDPAIADYFEEAVRLGDEHDITPIAIADEIVNNNITQMQINPAGLIKVLVQQKNKKYAKTREVQESVIAVLSVNQKAIDDFQSGKQQVIGYLIGQVQKELEGNGDPSEIRKIILETIGEN